MIKVNVFSEENSWSKKIKKKEKLFNQVCKRFPKKYRFTKKKTFLTLLLSNNQKIKTLNKKFRNKNKHTDILSFPFDEKEKKLKEKYLGDIIVNLNQIKRQKVLKNFKMEFDRLWIHGLVHLLGHDHKKNKEFLKMSRIEKRYFNLINV